MLRKVLAGLAAIIMITTVNPVNNIKAISAEATTISIALTLKSDVTIDETKNGEILLTYKGTLDEQINILRLRITSEKEMKFEALEEYKDTFDIYNYSMNDKKTELNIFVSNSEEETGKGPIFTDDRKSLVLGKITNTDDINVNVQEIEYVSTASEDIIK
ncbi:MAG: hypothetical protein K2G36_04805, partial [Ruminococcus sp.]|nr:hypothetical protein [Ruminococcus sp.]